MNRGTEDYIKTIYQLREKINEDDYVSNQSIVNELGHSAQTVNEMIKKLVTKDLVVYKRYKGTKLTERGVLLAVKMIRKHRLWELFLVEKLGYSWENVHKEAEDLEHATSDEMEMRLFKFLEEPKKCPHGNSIPKLDGSFEKESVLQLINGEIGKSFTLSRVNDDKELLIYLEKINLLINDTFTIKEIDELNESVKIEKNNLEKEIHTLGFKVAKKIYIK